MKKIHLVCNAHIDPVWLWQWEEGLGEALSTFRIAAEFCESHDGFIFNHNEALLYEWVEEHDPSLFERIRKLVKQGKWHIMGGWYLQPDCNMPSGESFARQMLYGKTYFQKKFGRMPETAINFDPFGHSRGLVQILCKAGFTSYLFCRPDISVKELPGEDFLWEGVDGSRILAHRSYRFYLSQKGKAADKVRGFMEKYPDKQTGLLLWGIGNHGGGPSRVDLERIGELMQEKAGEYEILHSTPENYFREIKPVPEIFRESIQPFAVGCYTSQIRIKQAHIQLENMLYGAEKMMSAAESNHLMEYDRDSAKIALRDLLFCEFHDILPGTSIQAAEEDALRQMGRGMQIASGLKAKAFYRMLSGQEKAEEGTLPIFVYNPHPYPVEGIFECEYMNEFTNTRQKFGVPHITRNGKPVVCQDEREASGLHGMDWRKKVAFHSTLEPSCMNRFDLVLEETAGKLPVGNFVKDGNIVLKSADQEVRISLATGLVDRLRMEKKDYLIRDAFRPLIIQDNADAWGMRTDRFDKVEDRFRLMTSGEARAFANVNDPDFSPVRVVDDGPLRTIVEAYMQCRNSRLILTYLIPKVGTGFQVKVRVYWNETDRMLKLSVPTVMKRGVFMGQIACGNEILKSKGEETIAQKWIAMVDKDRNMALGIVRDCFYGQSCREGELLLTLLRSPAYSGHPVGDGLIAQDRHYPRIDQGERNYSFLVLPGTCEEILDQIDRTALSFNERPMVMTAYPSGKGKKPKKLLELSEKGVYLQAFKRTEDNTGYVMRLFNPLDRPVRCTVSSEAGKWKETIQFGKQELKTFVIRDGILRETDILEQISGDKSGITAGK